MGDPARPLGKGDGDPTRGWAQVEGGALGVIESQRGIETIHTLHARSASQNLLQFWTKGCRQLLNPAYPLKMHTYRRRKSTIGRVWVTVGGMRVRRPGTGLHAHLGSGCVQHMSQANTPDEIFDRGRIVCIFPAVLQPLRLTGREPAVHPRVCKRGCNKQLPNWRGRRGDTATFDKTEEWEVRPDKQV